MKLNYDKCIHLRMNDIHTITYRNGQEMPRKTEATYLGGKIFADGSYKKEIRHRITNTWVTVRKLDLLWKKAPVSLKWKLRVFDTVIISKLLYGLEAIPFTEQSCKQLDAFQYRGLRQILGIKHSYWSGVKNKHVLLTASKKAKTEWKQRIIPISERLINRQVKLYGHLVMANEDDLMKNVTMYQDRTRRKSLFKRVGRPRAKWHTVTRKHTIKQLVDKNAILPNWDIHMKDPELDHIIIQAAADRDFCKTLT